MDDARDDRFSALDRLAALFEAGSTEEFWWRLVFGGGLPTSPNSWDAELLWRHQHGGDRSGASDTALLLCTDHGCRRATSGLIAAIASSGILDAEELARLAGRLLEGTTIVWEAPASWSEGGWIDIPLREVEEPDSAPPRQNPDHCSSFAGSVLRSTAGLRRTWFVTTQLAGTKSGSKLTRSTPLAPAPCSRACSTLLEDSPSRLHPSCSLSVSPGRGGRYVS